MFRYLANQAMHLSREVSRFETEDFSSRRGDRNRYPTESTYSADMSNYELTSTSPVGAKPFRDASMASRTGNTFDDTRNTSIHN